MPETRIEFSVSFMPWHVGIASIVVNDNICKILDNIVSSSQVKPSPRPYHHGNLRQAVLSAAEVALEARGVQHLSLRELSRELGVSHASPQRHFATKQDLIDALAIMGFERLSSVVAKAAEARSQDFNARLTKAAFAYVGFALKHPALFALMFEAKRRAGMLPELRTALMAAYSHIPKILYAVNCQLVVGANISSKISSILRGAPTRTSAVSAFAQISLRAAFGGATAIRSVCDGGVDQKQR
jgi:AcrR family transcriptional regulator